MLDSTRPSPRATFAVLFLTIFTVLVPAASASWWTEEAPALARVQAMDELATMHRTFRVDHEAFRAATEGIPRSYTGQEGRVLEIPTPDGTPARFRIVEDSILSPELAAHRPDARFYRGVGVDDPAAHVRLGITDEGMHARVRSINGSWTLDWSVDRDPETTMGWWDRESAPRTFACGTTEEFGVTEIQEELFDGALDRRLGNVLRTYRFAMNATGEFTEEAGGNVSFVESVMMTLTNQLTALYEKEFSVRFELVGMNVYTNAATDDFTDGTNLNSTLLFQSTDALNSVIGVGNYDVGHIISTVPGGAQGGLAFVGQQCSSGLKGSGGTLMGASTAGSVYPIMIHEVGHQLGASHSFNSTLAGCNGNRSSSQAYEIGSGVTIMSYAGLCASDNVQGDDIDFFNVGSYFAIRSEIITSSSCGTTVFTGNSEPVAAALPTLTIPRETAFVLTAEATDGDGDQLTYSWEQFELGTPGPPVDPASGPTFRNFAPTTDPERYFPTYAFYRGGANAPWEFLPTVDRTIPFRYLVRDNNPAGGGTTVGSQTVVFSGDPFVVNGPAGGESYEGGTEIEVTWDVGGSVSDDVKIYASLDDARTWIEVVASTANDGSAMVPLPCEATTEGRIRIDGIDNPFYDLNPLPFTITQETTPPVVTAPATFTVQTANPDGLLPDDPALQPWLDAISVVDACDGELTPNILLPASFAIGSTVVPITSIDSSGNLGFATSTVIVELDDATDTPSNGRLETGIVKIAPNPFNPRTTIEFALERAQNVMLTVFDTRGRRVALLADGEYGTGTHDITWTGVDTDGRQVPSGVYFMRLETEDGAFNERAVLLK